MTTRNRRKKTPAVRYVGFAQHIFRANKQTLLDAFEDACENRASRITLTIDLPTFAMRRKEIALHLSARLPVYSRFAVVDIDDAILSHYRVAETTTWEEAIAAAREHIPHLKAKYRLQIIGLSEDGLRDDVELMTYHEWPCGADHEEPPVARLRNAGTRHKVAKP